jgi:gamma-glutamylcyclotransferase (GGCT)/AIG2-like uncharacterized protein YtfP
MRLEVTLFVYGSLKRGFCHHARLQGAVFEGEAITEPHYGLVLLGDYPALYSGGGKRVRGELYRIKAELLTELDQFEDCPNVYQRESIALQDGSRAFAYLIDAERAQRCTPIESERWTKP